MATYATTAAPDNSTDAGFRAWIAVVHSVMTAGGSWTQTSDTGQINFGTVTRPTLANEKRGYALYAMTDSLQSSRPIIIKFAFGSGALAASPGIWFSIGTATDGAGEFIDPNDDNRPALLVDMYSQTAAAMMCVAGSTTALISFGSSGSDRASFLLFEPAQPSLTFNGTIWNVTTDDHSGAPTNFPMLFNIERGRDANGNVDGERLLVQWSGRSTAAKLNSAAYVPTTHEWPLLAVAQGLASYQLWYGTQEQNANHDGNVADDGSPGVYVHGAPVTGIIPYERNTVPAPPGIGLLVSRWPHFEFTFPAAPVGGGATASYLSGATVAVSPYGAAHTYRSMSGVRTAFQSTQDSYGYIMMRWE
jgi:hypothetical protein